MKYLTILCLGIACICIYSFTDSTVKEDVEVTFTTDLTKSDLERIQRTMNVLNIELTYEDVSYDADGYLNGLHFSVDCNDGFSGSASAFPLTTDMGFYRNYGLMTDNPFGTWVDDISGY